MNNPQSKERRTKGRLKLRLPVQVQLPDGQLLALTTGNLSDTGVFLNAEPEQMPPVGTELLLSLEAMPFDPPEVRVKVVHHRADGFGVKFLLDSPDEET